MGIDYGKFFRAAGTKATAAEKKRLLRKFSSLKRILSIDRQDYSKGILNRLEGYKNFLAQYPRWQGRVTLLMVVIPSRIGLESYQSTKNRIDALVGNINGTFGNMQWTPVVYQYRSLSFNELSAFYAAGDVALVTPLRDGMNLIAKEYVASRTSHKGVLILSEMAGAVEELNESLVINPNNPDAIATALQDAFNMPEDEQRRRMVAMQERVRNYSVFKWAEDFLATLQAAKGIAGKTADEIDEHRCPAPSGAEF
jgi:trehalose 6-phosphate synthase/phosphatase